MCPVGRQCPVAAAGGIRTHHIAKDDHLLGAVQPLDEFYNLGEIDRLYNPGIIKIGD